MERPPQTVGLGRGLPAPHHIGPALGLRILAPRQSYHCSVSKGGQSGACVARLLRSCDTDGKRGWGRYIKALDGAILDVPLAFALEQRSLTFARRWKSPAAMVSRSSRI
jgi:hypothetical protein